MNAHILRIFEQATTAERAEGEAWYETAHTYCVGASRRYGVTPRQAAGVVAALSPRVSWEQNLRMADQLLGTGTVPGLKGNVAKAIRIRDGAAPLDVLGGPKVRAFFECIADPAASRSVVVDRHAFDIAHGAVTDDRTRKALDRKGQYENVADQYRTVATQLGALPHVVQATTWVAWRRLKKEGKV